MTIIEATRQRISGGQVATLVLLFGQGSAALGAVLVNILAARVLDPADRGDLAFALQIAYFLTVLAIMGMERPYIAEHDGGFNAALLNFARLMLPGALLILPIAFLVVHFSFLGERWLLYGLLALAVYTAFNALSQGVRVGYVVSREWRIFGTYAILTQLLIIAGAVLLAYLDVARPEAWVLVYMLSTLPALILLFRAWRRRRREIEPLPAEQSRRIRRKGWILLPADFSNTAMTCSDRLLLPILSSSAELGLYVTVATVLEMASWPVKQWVDASLRGWAKSGAELSAQMPKIMLKAFGMLVVLAAVLGIAAYAMIHLVLPDSYARATTVIVPLAIGAVIFGLTRIQQGFLIALGAAGSVSAVEIVGTATSLVAFVILIPAYGMFGAAFGAIVGYLTCLLLGAILLLRTRKKV